MCFFSTLKQIFPSFIRIKVPCQTHAGQTMAKYTLLENKLRKLKSSESQTPEKTNSGEKKTTFFSFING